MSKYFGVDVVIVVSGIGIGFRCFLQGQRKAVNRFEGPVGPSKRS